jgi:predicted dehydrogenase
MKKKVRVLLIGAAFAADLHADAYSRLQSRAEIIGICARNKEHILQLAEKYGLEDFTAYDDYRKAIAECECDLVDICMPNHLHCAVALEALKKGRDIICEKPLATTVEDAEIMVETARIQGRHIYYAEDWLFAPAFRKAMEILESERLGRALYFRARESHSGSHSPFAQKIAYCGGGCMVHLGVHPVSFILALKDNAWSSLMAMTSGGGMDNIVHKTMEGEDWQQSVLRFDDAPLPPWRQTMSQWGAWKMCWIFTAKRGVST